MISAAELIQSDLDQDLLRMIATRAPWQYRQLADQIAEDDLIPEYGKMEEFARRRGPAIASCIIDACERFGVPYDTRRLPCNGQRKLVVKAGRLIMIQEPILTLGDAPRIADYKRQMARSLGAVSQLELPLGDRLVRMIDFSQGQLVVLLHGMSGMRFNEEQTNLGALMLAVPNAEYTNWVHRFDLHNLAMFGTAEPPVGPEDKNDDEGTGQPDRVQVRPRRRIVEEER
ncbi:hypothetical protein [Aureimonas glaciei]|uniref:Uncharacterized protein n=1 Tax=Aureimonas glaciei TaxID=1776957 RepID=A0A916YDW1_9HYPH|nr:hypothetical protein [Aureimonas glaciei]GGD40869.1 hypothetical protein GCM10011335_49490 [Aureimonas glaciei]